jgi:hypothetical protein
MRTNSDNRQIDAKRNGVLAAPSARGQCVPDTPCLIAARMHLDCDSAPPRIRARNGNRAGER